MGCAGRMAQFEAADLYVVITESFCAGRSVYDVLDAVLDAGVGLVQLREKEISTGELYERALMFRERTAECDAILIVNDRLDIALAVEADGVHLGQSDLPIEVAKSLAPEMIIGASTHSLEQALAAQVAGADYVNIGPIFDTQTKSTSVNALGPAIIEEIAPHLTVPFSCMGGIKLHNIGQVLERGARHPAVVTAVSAAPDVRGAAEELRARVLHYKTAANS